MVAIEPTSVLAELGPLDSSVAPGWRLEDVRWSGQRIRIDVEIRRDSEVLICTLDEDERGALRAGYTDHDSTWEGDQRARHALATQVLGPAKKRFEGAAFAVNDGSLAEQVREKVVPWRPAEWPTQGEQWRLLDGLRAPYRRTFKTEVRALEHDGGWSLHFPLDQVRPRNTYARWSVPRRFHRREFRAYFAQLGFGVDERGEMNIVPTPETFERRVRQQQSQWPFEPLLRAVRRPASNSAWAGIWMDDKLPMMVSRPLSVGTSGVYAHDVGFHGCLFHRIDADSWSAVTEVLRPGVAEHGTKGLAQAGLFIESALSRTAIAAWNDSRSPGEFDGHFQRRLPHALDIARAHVEVAGGRLSPKDLPTVE